MKISAKLLVLFITVTTIISGIFYLRVSAQDAVLTSQQTEQIIGNCTILKNTLNQLHSSDALLRVNMGQLYELVSTKLMDRFNKRISSNNFKIDNLTLAYNTYNSNLNNFRSDYITYEESLTTAIKIDCKSQPSVFYNSLLAARYNRGRVYEDVKKLNQQIDQYRLAMTQFEKDFQAMGNK